MITGTAQMDGAILVVAATDGIQPQTREHLRIAKQNGIQRVVVFITKADMQGDEELLELVEMEIRECLTDFGFDGDETPVIVGSALNAVDGGNPDLGENKIHELLDAVDTWISQPARELDKPFMLPIAQVYQIEGQGVVCTGRVERGKVKKGDIVQCIRHNTEHSEITVAGVKTFRKTLEEGEAGDLVGVLLTGLKKDDVQRGQFLCAPGAYTANNHCKVEAYILKMDEGGRKVTNLFFSTYAPVMYTYTADVPVRTILPDGKEFVQEGETTTLTFKSLRPVIMEKGQKFTLREGGRTVGIGMITEILPKYTDKW